MEDMKSFFKNYTVWKAYNKISLIIMILFFALSTKIGATEDRIEKEFLKIYNEKDIKVEKYEEINKLKKEAENKHLKIREYSDFYYDMKKNEVTAILHFESQEEIYESSSIYKLKLNNIFYPRKSIESVTKIYAFVDKYENEKMEEYIKKTEKRVRKNNLGMQGIAILTLINLVVDFLFREIKKEKEKEEEKEKESYEEWLQEREEGKVRVFTMSILKYFMYANAFIFITGYVYKNGSIYNFYTNPYHIVITLFAIVIFLIVMNVEWENHEAKYKENKTVQN